MQGLRDELDSRRCTFATERCAAEVRQFEQPGRTGLEADRPSKYSNPWNLREL